MTVDGGRWTGGSLPRLVLIADGFAGGTERLDARAIQQRSVKAVRTGRVWLHLRDHAVAAEAFARAARALVERVRAVQPGVVVSVNTYAEVAEALGVGLHVGVRGPAVAEARRRWPRTLLSYAAHTSGEAVAAADDGADAVFFSPVFPTASKPGHQGVGLGALAACCAAVPSVPVFALGGIAPERVRACRAAGAYGVAVLSGILHAADPVAAATPYLTELQP